MSDGTSEGVGQPTRIAGSEVPAGWRVIESWGPGPFVTHARLERPDGTEVEWSSRRHRKLLGLGRHERPSGQSEVQSARRTAWWLGALFMIGSTCFAVGSVPLFFDNVSTTTTAYTFFIGSIFFTSAAYLQFHETLAAPESVAPEAPRLKRLRSFVGWTPRRIDWWASGVQLVGTVFFNITTFAATRAHLDLEQEKHLIWAPDAIGSIAFLIASWLAYAEVNRGVLPRSDRSLGWKIAALNMLGAVAFGVSAVAARYLPATGEPANIALINLGTLAGALCFFAGAALLPVEAKAETRG